jgi:hypothetical protein
VGKPEEKRPRHRCKNNIKTNLQELGWGMDWIALTQDKIRWRTLVNAVMKFGFRKVRGTS